MYIKAYSESMAYSGIFRTVDRFSFRHYSEVFHTHSESYLIHKYSEFWLIYARNVSHIFRHIRKVTYIEAYLPTLGFAHIEEPGFTSSNNVKQHLLFSFF